MFACCVLYYACLCLNRLPLANTPARICSRETSQKKTQKVAESRDLRIGIDSRGMGAVAVTGENATYKFSLLKLKLWEVALFNQLVFPYIDKVGKVQGWYAWDISPKWLTHTVWKLKRHIKGAVGFDKVNHVCRYWKLHEWWQDVGRASRRHLEDEIHFSNLYFWNLLMALK